MKKEFFLMVAGAAVLAGCSSNKVMNDRYYVPAAAGDPAAVESVEEVQPLAPTPAAPVKPAAPAVSYEPMKNVRPSGGVDSARGVSGKTAAGGVYVVKSGDTMGKIAARHNVRLNDLLAANNMTMADAKRLAVGRKLVIPGGKGTAAAKKNAAAPKKGGKKAKQSASSAALAADGTYVVRSGDTLAVIARRLNVKTSDLQKANNLSDAAVRRLQVGQKLVVPGKSPVTATASAAAPVTATVDAPKPAEPAVIDDASVRNADQQAAPAADAAAVPAATSTAPALTGTADAAAPAADTDNTEMIVVSEDSITIEAFAAKHGVTVEDIRKHNKEYDKVLKKDDLVFVPKK